jgi:DNA-binding IclR family transcriptional regulator
MACLNPDGTLTRSAQAVLESIGEGAGEQQILQATGVPRFQVRSLLRDMTKADLVVCGEDGVYRLTEQGADLLATVTG